MSNTEVVELARIMLFKGGVDKRKMGVNNTFIRRDSRADKEVRDILWLKDTDEQGKDKYLYYTFNSQQQAFKSLDRETIEELLASGMIEFYKDQQLPGFKDWIPEKEYQAMRNSRQDR